MKLVLRLLNSSVEKLNKHELILHPCAFNPMLKKKNTRAALFIKYDRQHRIPASFERFFLPCFDMLNICQAFLSLFLFTY